MNCLKHYIFKCVGYTVFTIAYIMMPQSEELCCFPLKGQERGNGSNVIAMIASLLGVKWVWGTYHRLPQCPGGLRRPRKRNQVVGCNCSFFNF